MSNKYTEEIFNDMKNVFESRGFSIEGIQQVNNGFNFYDKNKKQIFAARYEKNNFLIIDNLGILLHQFDAQTGEMEF